LVTLYLTPVVYTYFDRLQQRFGRSRPERARTTEPVAVGVGANGEG
jgi:hypothetical protein